jgi:hypothetical protein
MHGGFLFRYHGPQEQVKGGASVANELTGSFALSLFKPSVMNQADGMSVANFIQSWSGTVYSKGPMEVSSSVPTAIPLGQVVSPGMCVFSNRDLVNYISIQNGSGGTEFLRLIQSDWAFCRLGPGVVPYALANTAGCTLQFWIISP